MRVMSVRIYVRVRAALPWIKQTKYNGSTALNIPNEILPQLRKE